MSNNQPTPESAGDTKRCLICGATSEDRLLLRGEYQGQETWVCASCLPRVIHGAH
ncbi:MAG: hypothetical protein M1136_00540 [Chloroflexi bacterium]|nr:hypothetical protein [Chloroflexota bacterium]MCL5074128.1 hypothetical protein [Chloroflexota bacterium]